MVYQNKACRGIFGGVSGWGEMQGTENENAKIGFAEAPAPQPSSNKFGTVFGLIGAVAAPRQKRRKSSAMTELVREWPKRSPFSMQSKPKLRLALRSACTFVAAEDWLRRSPCASTVLEQVRDGIRLNRGCGCASAKLKQAWLCARLALSLQSKSLKRAS